MNALRSTSPSETSADGATDDYELMRYHELGHHSDVHPELGRVLFLRSGMSAWIWARARWQRPTPRSRQSEGERDAPLPARLRGELAMLWAAMAVGTIQQEALT